MRTRDVTASLRRHWPTALGILVLIPIVLTGYLVTRDVDRPPARYTTSAEVLIPSRLSEAGDDSGEPLSVPPVLFQGQTELATSPRTRAVALSAAGFDPNEPTNISFSATMNETLDIITLSVSAPEPELASQVLDAYTEAFEDGRRQSVLDAAIDRQEVQRDVITILTRRVERVEAELVSRGVPLPAVGDDGARVAPPDASLDTQLLLYERNALYNERIRRQTDYALQSTRARIPGDYTTIVQRRSAARVAPPPPSPLVPSLVIVGFGVLLALAVPVLMDRFDGTLRDRRAMASALRSRVLGTIPALHGRRTAYAQPGSDAEAAHRTLAATAISTDRLPKAIMVSTPVGDTFDTIAADLAYGLASLGVTTALVGTVPRQRWFLDGPEPIHGAPSSVSGNGHGTPGDGDLPDELDAESTGGTSPPPPPSVPPGGPTASPADEPSEGTTIVMEGETVATLPRLLEEAHTGGLPSDLRSTLTAVGLAGLYVIPPGDADEPLQLDGLPPLLEALSNEAIDVVVIAGPAFLEDADATIIAWTTRSVLWAIEVGRVNARDAQLAAERLEIGGVDPFGVVMVEHQV